MLNLTAASACPGLFYGVSSQDGMLARIRIPGGIINIQQWDFLRKIADKYAAKYLQITNRANLQIREIHQDIPLEDLQQFQVLHLGAQQLELDALRNIMASPTAGIDSNAVIDTRCLIQDIDTYLQTHSELQLLSPKFSIGIDGGERVSICDRHNDILLVARRSRDRTRVYFQLFINGQDSHYCFLPDQVLKVIDAIAQVYLVFCQQHPSQRRHRLRQVLNNWGMDGYLQRVAANLQFALVVDSDLDLEPISQPENHDFQHQENNYSNNFSNQDYQNQHIGIYPQSQNQFVQNQLVYIGLVLKLGRVETWQMAGIGEIIQVYGDGTLRLTPWQNLIIPNLEQTKIPEILSQLEKLELDWHSQNPWNGLIACSGTQGCASSHINTHTLAQTLADQLPPLKTPLKIHISGCEKGCASQGKSDITLVGIAPETYRIFISNHRIISLINDDKNQEDNQNEKQKFGREIYTSMNEIETQEIVMKMAEKAIFY